MRGWLAEAGDAVVSVFFPAGCRICDKLLVRASRVPFCEECLSSFEAPLEKKCEVCGQSLAWMAVTEGEPLVCRACQQKTYAFERARSFGIYDGASAGDPHIKVGADGAAGGVVRGSACRNG